MLNVAVLVSGGGTNLQALIDAEKAGALGNGKLALVLSSRKDAYALTRAEKAGIPTEILLRKTFAFAAQDDYDSALLELLERYKIGLVVLAGFMTIISERVVKAYPNRIINVHPALIPSFCGEGFYGLRVHEAVLKKGVRLTGATVHFVNEVCDGGPIILQKAVEVLPGDTPELLQRRVMEQAEWKLLPKAVALFCSGRLNVVNGTVEIKGEESVMEKKTIACALGGNPYPGRGIILGRSEDGNSAVIAYFIMGRSENSRNRIFIKNGDGIQTKAFDESKMTDPSLIIYWPVRVLGSKTIVTNGDQTDTVNDFLSAGKTFEDALRTRTYEPDAPNYTPRISGLVERGEHFAYHLSILKSAEGRPECAERCFYEYSDPFAGEGRLIHTYTGDGNPLPSFEGEPTRIEIKGGIDAFAGELWQNLSEENRVSLFVRFINLKTGQTESRIINKNN
jgi:phosphoribosylglycinamide formyltransferase-1